MRTVGVFLIHAGVTLRCLIRLPRMQHPGWVIALLALNAILLILEAWLSRRRAAHPAGAPAFDVDLRPVYLLLQAVIVTGSAVQSADTGLLCAPVHPDQPERGPLLRQARLPVDRCVHGGPGRSSHHLESWPTFGRGAGVELRRPLLFVRRLRLPGAQGGSGARRNPTHGRGAASRPPPAPGVRQPEGRAGGRTGTQPPGAASCTTRSPRRCSA